MGRRGVRNLSKLVEERANALGLTRSKLEALVSDFLRRHGIHGGQRNYDLVIDGNFIACLDVAWPDLKVGIEVDSRRWHMGHAFWERDSARYAEITSHDWRILPVTSGQLKHRGAEFAEHSCGSWCLACCEGHDFVEMPNDYLYGGRSGRISRGLRG